MLFTGRRAAKKEAQKTQETKETGAGGTTCGRRNCCRTQEEAEEKKRFNDTEPWVRDLAQSQDKVKRYERLSSMSSFFSCMPVTYPSPCTD